MHDLPLITTIAVGFSLAWLLGLLTQALRLSPIVGYLLAGVFMGPYTPGFTGDLELAHQLAEIGVILLMFGVGLHFHLKDLLAVKGVAIPGAIGQSAVATAMGFFIFQALGFPPLGAAVVGMAMAVASTVVLMRVLIDADMLNSSQGHVAVGWLLVEDVFTVIVLVLIPVLGASAGDNPHAAAAGPIWMTLGLALFKLGVLVAVVMVLGARVIPWVLVQVARLRSRELFTLTVLVFSIAIAAGAFSFFGASMALGAFLAGMVVAQSPVSHQAAADALPLRDAFAVLFFVSVGMLFDPSFLVKEPLMILAALGIILIAKPLAALAIVALLGHSSVTALTVALGLAQIGEFSFILADQASEVGILPEAGRHVLVGGAILSIILNPALFRMLRPIESWLRARPALWKALNRRAERHAEAINSSTQAELAERLDERDRLAILVGYGPVGRAVHRLLQDAGLPTVVIETNMDTVSELKSQGQPAIYGDATRESILEQAGAERASHIVVTVPNVAARLALVTAARNLNPQTRILVRAHYLREREDLEQAGATAAVFEEAEAAVALARLVMADTGAHRDTVERKVRDLRFQLTLENMSNLRAQRVRGVMVPWTRVRKLSTGISREEVLRQVAEHRFTRWPVIDPAGGKVIGYLLAKDLISRPTGDGDWLDLVRPLGYVHPDSDIESTLMDMQNEKATIRLVKDAESPVGLITLEDILEQVVGRMEDEYPHTPEFSLAQAVAAGGIVLDLTGHSPERAIHELADAIPASRLPGGENTIAELALARERELPTDLGVGVAIPHARLPRLSAPLVVFGRSASGILFSPESPELVRLVFLLVTPIEQPNLQLSILAQLARVAGDRETRERLLAATSADEVLEILAGEAQQAASATER